MAKGGKATEFIGMPSGGDNGSQTTGPKLGTTSGKLSTTQTRKTQSGGPSGNMRSPRGTGGSGAGDNGTKSGFPDADVITR